MHLRHRALFIGYAPADNPTIAVAVVVEGGGYGASTAAPIARKILDAWLLGKMPEPDPKVLAAELAANPFANVVSSANTAIDTNNRGAKPTTPAVQEPAR